MDKGKLACVGIGMMLGGHITPRAASAIAQAEVVFVLVSDPLVEAWLKDMREDVRSLEGHYREGVSRLRSYRAMVEAILAPVRAGQRVCAAFYGHPGVFAWVPHRAIAQARAEGHDAWMEPGISAADCLYADLGIDPGRVGCQHYEATQFMLYRRRVEPSAWLVLWQVGLAGDRSLARFATGPAQREVLVDVLARDYPRDHRVIIYRAATLAVQSPRIAWLALAELPDAELGTADTLVVPPLGRAPLDAAVAERLAALDPAVR